MDHVIKCGQKMFSTWAYHVIKTRRLNSDYMHCDYFYTIHTFLVIVFDTH